MRLDKSSLKFIFLSLTMSCASFAFAADSETPENPVLPLVESSQGQINFTGYINDVPCSIDSDSLNQNIDFGEIRLPELTNAPYRSDKRSFDIVLKNCSTETYKRAEIKFTGSTINNITGFDGALLSINSDKVKNAGVVITTLSGKVIKFGEYFSDAGNSYDLNDGSGKTTTLHFASYVKGNESTDKTKQATVGRFSTVANFVISYQ